MEKFSNIQFPLPSLQDFIPRDSKNDSKRNKRARALIKRDLHFLRSFINNKVLPHQGANVMLAILCVGGVWEHPQGDSWRGNVSVSPRHAIQHPFRNIVFFQYYPHPSRNTFKIHTNFTYPKDEKYSFACVLILYEEKKKIVDRYTIRPTRIKNNINNLNNVTRVRMQKNVSNVKEGTIYIYIQVQNRIFIIVVSRPRYVSVSRSVF